MNQTELESKLQELAAIYSKNSHPLVCTIIVHAGYNTDGDAEFVTAYSRDIMEVNRTVKRYLVGSIMFLDRPAIETDVYTVVTKWRNGEATIYKNQE